MIYNNTIFYIFSIYNKFSKLYSKILFVINKKFWKKDTDKWRSAKYNTIKHLQKWIQGVINKFVLWIKISFSPSLSNIFALVVSPEVTTTTYDHSCISTTWLYVFCNYRKFFFGFPVRFYISKFSRNFHFRF